jgi:deoxyadenosine/deoxycytidine kinase
METRDYANYFELYQTMCQFLQPPDLVIYVKRSVPVLKERIRERGRDYETDIPTAYLEHLNKCYDEWIAGYRMGKVLTIEADQMDLKYNPEHFSYVCAKIENSLEQPDLFSVC